MLLIRVVLLTGLLGVVPRALQAQAFCVAPADTIGRVLLANVRVLASSTEKPYVEARARGGIPLTDSATVTYVIDERICERLAQAVSTDALKRGRTPSNRVRAIKLGDLFVVQDPSVTFKGGPVTYYVTKTYKVKSHYGG